MYVRIGEVRRSGDVGVATGVRRAARGPAHGGVGYP